VDALMKITTGTTAGYAPRRFASIFDGIEGTGAPTARLRDRSAGSPLAEPDSHLGVLTV